jgi:phosphatidylinositol alpha-1,6-mannosyltransferase
MNVLLLATRYFGLGGAEGYTRLMARAAAEEGAQIDVLSLLDGSAAPRTCPGRYLGDQGGRSTRWTRTRFLAQALRYGGRYDLVICSHVAVAPVGLLLSRTFRVPFIVIGYGIDVWDPLSPLRRKALQRAARVIVLSHFTGRMVATVQAVAADRICVIHPAVDPALLALAAPASDGDIVRYGEPLTLLTVARLSAQERYKGVDTVIAALPAIADVTGPVRYVIVGDGDDEPRLRALARDRGVTAAVTFAGPAQGAALAARYRASDIFVMPSLCEQRPDGWAGEGFGIVYIEAAAFARPVVAGQGGGAPEAVQNGVTGFVVDGRSVDAVTAALTRLSRDRALRVRMGDAGRLWVRQCFTHDRFRREVGDMLRLPP